MYVYMYVYVCMYIYMAQDIKGNMWHPGLKVPVNRGFEYCTLDSDRLKY